LDIEAAGKLKTHKYQGVLQEQLAATLMHSVDCRKDVFDTLVIFMLRRQPQTPKSG
jgi:hypothetical protein